MREEGAEPFASGEGLQLQLEGFREVFVYCTGCRFLKLGNSPGSGLAAFQC